MSQSLDIICAAIDELNAQIADEGPDARLIEKAEATRLFGSDDGMDSLQLVNLIVAIENHIQDATGQSVVLMDESTMGLDNNPFETVGGWIGAFGVSQIALPLYSNLRWANLSLPRFVQVRRSRRFLAAYLKSEALAAILAPFADIAFALRRALARTPAG